MSILKIIDKYPELRSIELTDLNIKVFEALNGPISGYENLKYCFAINFYSNEFNDIACFDKKSNIVSDLKNIISNKKVTNPHSLSLSIYLAYIEALLEEKQKISSSEAKYALYLLKGSKDQESKSSIIDPLFKISDPQKYNKITGLLLSGGTNVLSYIRAQNNLKISIKKTLSKYSFQYETSSRIKALYSLSEKIENKNLSLEQINDLLGLRIYLKEPDQCFEVMKVMIKEYKVLRDKLKDYITYPKDNGYQSLHMIIDYKDIPIEIQIRTYEMHKNCQTGSADHINYKKSRGI